MSDLLERSMWVSSEMKPVVVYQGRRKQQEKSLDY